MKKGNTAKKRRGSIAARVIVVVFVLYFSFLLVSLRLQIGERREELEQLQQIRDELEISNGEYQSLIDEEMDEEYIIRVARSELGLAMPGERVFIDTSKR